MNHPILFVSLGPGDAEFITLKALKALQEADTIYYPSVLLKSGKEISRAWGIMEELKIDKEKAVAYQLPMNPDNRQPALDAYHRVSELAVTAYSEGKKAVFVAEGDASFYSSFAYVRDFLQDHQVPIKTLPGVAAFLAAAASINMPFLRLEEELHVMPAPKNIDEMKRALDRGELLLLMKLSKSEAELKAFIQSHGETYAYNYFENVSCPNAYECSDRLTILDRPFPYFSMLLIRKQ